MPDGLQSYCIDCSKERSKERYTKFSDEQKKVMRDRAKKQSIAPKQFIWDFLKINPCVDCGESDPIVLDFDHLFDKKKAVSSLASSAVSLDSIKDEILKCEVRCANCHRKKTAIQFGWYKNIVP